MVESNYRDDSDDRGVYWDGTPEEEQQWLVTTAKGRLMAALEAHYDEVAKRKEYDSRYTCALRAGYGGPFQAEGTAFAVWMDTCNKYAYGVMIAVLAGTRAIPTEAELIAELPSAPW